MIVPSLVMTPRPAKAPGALVSFRAQSALVAPRKVPQQSRSRFTVDAILIATERALLRHGYEAMSTRRIADEAGASVGTLYEYFPNKEALVFALWEREERVSLALYDRALALFAGAPLHLVPHGILTALIDQFQREVEFCVPLLEQTPLRAMPHLHLDSTRHRAVRLRDFLEARRETLRTRDLDRASLMVVEMVWTMVRTAAHHFEPMPKEQLVDDAAAAVLGYLAPRELDLSKAPSAGWPLPA